MWDLAPLNERQIQLVLGTLLGDGNLSRTSGIAGVYNSTHSSKQHEYNLAKYQILSEFCNNPPKIIVNRGYGKFSSRWYTRSLPIFAYLYTLIYPNGRKTVTQDWLEHLTTEGLAWWYLDDGTLCRGRKATIATNSFNELELKLLVQHLRVKRGLETSYFLDKRGYWTLFFPPLTTRALLQLIRPFTPPSMQYKLAWAPRLCTTCGNEVLPPSRGSSCSVACRRATRQKARQKYESDPINREKKAQQARRHYLENLEQLRARGRETAQRYRENHRAEMRQRGHERYQQLKDDPAFRVQRTENLRRYYQTVRNDPERWAARRAAANARRNALRRNDPAWREKQIQRVREWRAKQALPPTLSSVSSTPA